MFNKKFFLTLWLTISFFTSAQVVFGQITLSQPVTIAQKTVPKRAVAIITFENLSAFHENDWVGACFAESLTTKLSKLESLDLYERRQLHTVIAESGLDQGQVSEAHWEKAEQIGSTLHLTGVQSVLIGSVAMMGSYANPDVPLQVNARTVNVETGAITRGEAFSVQGKFSQLFDLQTLLAQQFVSALGVEPTSEEEGRMQERETESLAAYRLYILGLQALDEGRYADAKRLFYEAYQPRNFSAAREGFAIASEREIEEKEKSGIRDETGRAVYAQVAEADASKGAEAIYYLGRQRLFDGQYDEAIDAYQTFLKYTQNKVLRWKYQTKSSLETPPGPHWANIISPPQYPSVVANGMVYIVDGDALYALESDSGRLLWTVGMKHASQPIIADGTLYISDREGGTLSALEAKTGEVLWSSKLGVRLGRSAQISENLVYVWSNQPIDTPDTSNTIYALRRADGSRLWERNVGARRGYSSPFTVSDGTVYVFSISPPTWNDAYKNWDWANTCTLSALDGNTGNLLWESKLPIAYGYFFELMPQDYAPVVSEGRVYVVEADSQRPYDNSSLYALSAADGGVLWCSEVKCSGSLPLVSGGAVYVPSRNGIYVFDAKSGALRAEFLVGKETTRWSVNDSLVVADGILYARPGPGWDGSTGDTLYAFSLETGALLWQYRAAEGIQYSFRVVKGIVYLTAEDRMLYALNEKTGQLLWKYELNPDRSNSIGRSSYSDPTVVDDSIYVSGGSTLYALNVSGASSLTPSDLDARVAIGRALVKKKDLTTARATLQAVIETKPNVIEAWMLLAEIAEQLKETREAIKAWQKVSHYASPLDGSYRQALQHLGELAGLRWRFKPEPAFSRSGGWVSGTDKLAATKGGVYVHDSGGKFLYKLESQTGRILEKHEDGTALPHLMPGMVYLYYSGKLYALEAQTERVLWSYDIGYLHKAYVLDQTLFIEGASKLYALSAFRGNLLWESEGRGTPRAGFNGTLYTTESHITADERHELLHAISSHTGELLWTYDIHQHYPDKESNAYLRFPSVGGSWLTASDDGVYLAARVDESRVSGYDWLGDVLLALDRTTGTLRWKYETKPYLLTETLANSNIVYALQPSYLTTRALNATTGELLWTQPVGAEFIAENTIYGHSWDGVMAVNAHSGQVLWQFKVEHGRYGTRFALSGGVLYTSLEASTPLGGVLYALDAATGMPLWTYDVGDRVMSSTVADGMLYLLTADGSMDALDIQQASVKLPPSPKLVAENYLERGQYAEAIESYQQALAQTPSDASILNSLGWVYWKTGQMQPALDAFQKALTLEPRGDAAAKVWSRLSEIAQSEIAPEIFHQYCNRLASIAPEDGTFQVRLRLLRTEFLRFLGDLEAAEKEYAKTGFPKESDWLVIGPFDNTEDKGRTSPYPPETEINLSATYQGKAGTVQWQKADDGQLNGRLDFTKIFTPTEWVVAYALIDVISPDDREAQLRIGSDDGVKVWLNGQVVWTNQAPRGLRLDEDVAPIALKKGINRLLFKIDNGVVAWEFTVRITDASGQPMQDLRFRTAKGRTDE